MPPEDEFPIDLSTDGDVAPRDVDRAQEHLVAIADLAPAPVLRGQIRLSFARSTPPAQSRVLPAKVEGALDVNGQLIRAQVAARTMQEAVDRFADRLRSQLKESAERRRARREASRGSGTDQWGWIDPSTDRPHYVDRPAAEREIVRRKSFAARSSTAEEAAFDMESLDHDFFLFRSADSGEESFLYRSADRGYELVRRGGGTGNVDVGIAPIRVSERIPPRLPLGDAVTALNVGNEPFVFFIDAEDDQGAVLYRRYDGHYGLITLDPEPVSVD